jgi:hypothetical protein
VVSRLQWAIGLATFFLGIASPHRTLAAQSIPTPESYLGFRVGQDSMLASWAQITGYFSRLAAASPRVRVDTLGASTLGRPFILVTVSDSANLARRTELVTTQRRLADPRTLSPNQESELVAAQPAVVMIICSIHSTEIAASQMSMELAYRLSTEPALGEALRHVVVLLVPSANPDGIDIVGDWYRDSRFTSWDGTAPPWLYHPYVGHDNNRDWFMLTQVETQLLTRVLYRDWFPEVVWDVHQMRTDGARMFVPPFRDPVNPNLDPMLVAGMNLVGASMAAALHDEGMTGVAHQVQYDLWWHGGARSTPTRHNMIGILTEAASARVASPLCLEASQLRQPAAGVNFPAPWPGGCWRLRDIVDYELVAAGALIRLAAAEREALVRRFVTLGRRQVLAGSSSPPFAYLLPDDSTDPGSRALLANLLISTGVEVRRAQAELTVDGRRYPAGTLVVPLDQPFRAHVKDLLEPQVYPERREYPGGPLVPPYDVAGWTLPLQMGVTAVAAATRVTAPLERVDTVIVPPGRVVGRGTTFLLPNRTNAEITLTWRALAAGGTAHFATPAFNAEGRAWPAGTLVLRAPRGVLEAAARELGVEVVATTAAPTSAAVPVIRGAPRVGLYRPWTASMDEGWTRWALERLGVPYRTVTDSIVRAGRLPERFDVIILPSEGEDELSRGRRPGTAAPQYTGGLGEGGAAQLRAFLEAGGTVVALGSASGYAVTHLGAPARVVPTARVPPSPSVSRFYAPGSIFGVEVDRNHPVASGLGNEVAVYFSDSPVLEPGPGARAILSYPTGRNPLLSGFVDGWETLSGRAALVEAPVDRGRAILFGFRPQHRGQTHGTFKLLTNALLYGAARPPATGR